MLYKEFAPLKEDYKTIIVSVTEIEKALTPKPSFVTELPPKKKANTYWVWNLIENIIFANINQWEEFARKEIEICRRMMNPERMKYYSPSWALDNQFQRLYDGLDQLIPLSKPYEALGMYDIRNLRSAVEVDFSGYKVILTGEIDWGMDGVALFDCKTAKKKWNENEKWEFECYQGRFYPWFQFLAHPDVDTLAFSYLVFTKQKTIQHQNITHMVTREEAEGFVKQKLYEYLLWVHKGEIETTENSLERM